MVLPYLSLLFPSWSTGFPITSIAFPKERVISLPSERIFQINRIMPDRPE